MTRVAGLIYGCILALLCFFVADFGHGLYFPLGVVAAPFSLAGPLVALLASPVLWGLVGFYTGKKLRPWRMYAVLLLIFNYVGAFFVLRGRDGNWTDYSRWSEEHGIRRTLVIVILALYAMGQIVLWWQLLNVKTPNPRTRYDVPEDPRLQR